MGNLCGNQQTASFLNQANGANEIGVIPPEISNASRQVSVSPSRSRSPGTPKSLVRSLFEPGGSPPKPKKEDDPKRPKKEEISNRENVPLSNQLGLDRKLNFSTPAAQKLTQETRTRLMEPSAVPYVPRSQQAIQPRIAISELPLTSIYSPLQTNQFSPAQTFQYSLVQTPQNPPFQSAQYQLVEAPQNPSLMMPQYSPVQMPQYPSVETSQYSSNKYRDRPPSRSARHSRAPPTMGAWPIESVSQTSVVSYYKFFD